MMSGSDILLATIHVITDWPIRDHMNQDFTQRSRTQSIAPIRERFRTQRAPNRGTVRSQGARTGS
ncbi:unnamed protein product [Staurois parvus]|uniref:Uncharacterized protein n=1 Tax=Staurois parvus TaxID=386267 RepID=A0ABN9FC62_9NEOB|nr:unnamed protein product [Staurois parvus]